MAGNLTAMIASIFSGGVTADPYYEYTTLLLPGNGTNGAQNNTFLDGSTNNFTITRNGNTTQGTFSPFSQTGWGNYFDGTGDYLSVADNASLELGSGDFCIEGWVYLTANSGAGVAFAAKNGGSFASWQIQASSTNWVYYLSSNGSTWNVASSVTMGAASLNTWTHIALVRNSGVVTPYINGVAGTTTTSSATIFNNSRGLTIGTVEGSAGSFSQYLTGYVSNFRLVVGNPVYTGAFNPPTSPLAATQSAGTNISAITGTQTSLLTCQSNRFIDNSTNNFTITRNGDTSVVAFSPFNPTASWSAATYGGSGYFDGNGDYLSVSSNAAFGFGTDDFCFEFWMNPIALSTSRGIYLTNATGGLYVYTDSSNKLVVRAAAVATLITSNDAVTLNSWTHVAVCRAGTTLSLYLNGSRTAGGTAVNSTNFAAGDLYIGSEVTTFYYSGYLASLRVVKGSAVYDPTQTTLTVPTAPLTAITNTSLLLNFTNAGIYDATSKNDLETVGNAQISNTTAQFGTTSIKFDGTGDWLTMPASPFWQFGTGDFTIEFWWYAGSLATYQQIITVTNDASISGVGEFVITYNTTLGLRFFINAGATIISQGSTSGWTTGQWYYIAAVRSGNTLTLYRNGSSIASGSVSGVTIGANVPFYIGGEPYTPVSINGYIQDLRVTNGYARTVTTSPTAPLPTF